jgi:ATP-dependent DNA helicase PIF1
VSPEPAPFRLRPEAEKWQGLSLEDRLMNALLVIAMRCDGAQSLDGVGFSKYDVPLYNELATKWGDRGLEESEIAEAYHLVRKYRKQLEGLGYNVDLILRVSDEDGGVVEIDGDLPLLSPADAPVLGPVLTAPEVKDIISGLEDIDAGRTIPFESIRKELKPHREAVIIDRSEIAGMGQGATVPCELLTGAAGTGKTHEILRRQAEDPNYGQTVATTGIAAINLGTITINSLLGYFDTESMEDAFNKGQLERRLRELADTGARNLIVDEISMLDKRQLNMLYRGVSLVNERRDWKQQEPLGLVLTGDFCQLPPVKAEWCFKADCWPQFEANTTRLTKCWRQSDQKFLDAINLIRKGDGRAGADLLRDMVEFVPNAQVGFDGTTIIAKNEMVDNFNFTSQSRLTGAMTRVTNERWGRLRSEWKWEMFKGKRIGTIPPTLELKIGALVMILNNDTPVFSYVNGDLGHIEDYDGASGIYYIKLKRTDEIVPIGPIVREYQQKDMIGSGYSREQIDMIPCYHPNRDEDIPFGVVYFNEKRRRYVTGGVKYYPLRLAYASTVHKTQGLSLDAVQIDCYNHFFGAPAMAYVAISRARTPQGLRIVGTPDLLAERVKVHPEVLRWL